MNKLDAIRAREQAATPESTGAWRINDDPGERPFLFAVPTMDDIVFIGHARSDIPLLLAVAEAAADVVAWHGTVQDLFRKEARGDEVSVSEMSRANSEWSDAMDRLSAALAVEEAQ